MSFLASSAISWSFSQKKPLPGLKQFINIYAAKTTLNNIWKKSYGFLIGCLSIDSPQGRILWFIIFSGFGCVLFYFLDQKFSLGIIESIAPSDLREQNKLRLYGFERDGAKFCFGAEKNNILISALSILCITFPAVCFNLFLKNRDSLNQAKNSSEQLAAVQRQLRNNNLANFEKLLLQNENSAANAAGLAGLAALKRQVEEEAPSSNKQEILRQIDSCTSAGLKIIKGEMSNIDISGLDLRFSAFNKAELSFARCVGVTFQRASLREVNFKGSSLEATKLIDADLTGANLMEANLNNANLSFAKMQEANLEGAVLMDAVLKNSNLKGACLQNANLRKAILIAANLEEANLKGANLAGANLAGANLRDADLRATDRTGADLTGADLTGALLDPENSG